MPAPSDPVQVVGLNEFRKELKAIDTKMPRLLGQANKRAGEMVAERARSMAASQGGVAAKSAPSIKASSAAASARVFIGGPAYPFALGAEFGSKKYPQFKPWRGNKHDAGMEPGSGVGYFVYPTIRATRDEFLDIYWHELGGVFRQAFPSGAAI